MDYAQYIEQKQNLQRLLLNFVEKNGEANEDYNLLITEIKKIINKEDENDLREFLYLVSNVTNNHHRQEGFIEKIERIINYFKNDIKQIFSNSRIFEIFKDNQVILLILFRNNLLSVDQDICDYIWRNKDHMLFFYPEIKLLNIGYMIIDIEKELFAYDPDVLLNFDQNRQKGENENYLARLIRNDLVKEFVDYYNLSSLTPFSEVKWSLFETNSILNRKETSIIEYACFYGSKEIFLFLISKVDESKIFESLWLYAIHSFNLDMIHIIEQKCKIPDNNYMEVLNEAIKCHHNDIASYILNNYIEYNKIDEKSKKMHNSIIYQYHNYLFFPKQICKDGNENFGTLCQYDYYKLVDFYLNTKKINVNESMVFI